MGMHSTADVPQAFSHKLTSWLNQLAYPQPKHLVSQGAMQLG